MPFIGWIVSHSAAPLIFTLSLLFGFSTATTDGFAASRNPLLSPQAQMLPLGVEGEAKTKVELLERYATYLLFRIQQLERRLAEAEQALARREEERGPAAEAGWQRSGVEWMRQESAISGR